MELEYCSSCGEAFLASKGACVRCDHTKTSSNRRGVKTTMLLGLLSLGMPSEGIADPSEGLGLTESVWSPRQYMLSYPEGIQINTQEIQAIHTVVQQAMPEMKKIHQEKILVQIPQEQGSRMNTQTRFAIKITIQDGVVSTAEWQGERVFTDEINSESFVQSVLQQSKQWTFPVAIRQSVIIHYTLQTESSHCCMSSPEPTVGGLYGVPSTPSQLKRSISLGTSTLPVPNSNQVVQISNPIILGGLEQSQLETVVSKGRAQFRYCYEKAWSQNPTLRGKIDVKFVISQDGSVSKAAIHSSDMDNAVVERCVVRVFKNFRFPKPDGGIVIVRYSLFFSQSE